MRDVFNSDAGTFTTIMYGQPLAVCAGLCAALASLSAKLAFSPTAATTVCQTSTNSVDLLLDVSLHHFCPQVVYPLRSVFFLLMFTFNGLMWTLFVRSLQGCSSSLQATVTNTAANFFLSAVIGWLFFGESLSLLWWIGASLILTGVLFIHKGSPAQLEDTDHGDKKQD